MGRAAATLYASVGNVLRRYEIDAGSATLTPAEAVTLPANVQYAWPHPSRNYLYAASSPRGPGGMPGQTHSLSALRTDPETGAITPHGEPRVLPHRPIHMTLDASGRYAIVAYNEPSGVTVHRLNDHGTIGETIDQPLDLDAGVYAHQVRMAPSNRTAVLVTRGNDAKQAKPEDPGALKLFRFENGVLANAASVAPNRGYGFGPRHIDFHPTKPWVYVALERQNQLQLYTLEGEGISASPLYTKTTLEEPSNVRPRQLGGTVHVHPGGRYVYMANRADHTVDFEGKKVFGGGENSIAVFSIDPQTGEPTLIQNADTHSIHVRTFAFDPSGKIMVAASITSLPVRDNGGVKDVPAALSVFRVGDDGKLTFARKYDIDTGGKNQWWMGIVGLEG